MQFFPQRRNGNDTNRSTCSTTRSEYGRRDPSKRVAGDLSVDQEEVLIGLMFDDFQRTGAALCPSRALWRAP